MREMLLPFGEGIFFDGEYKKDELYPLYIQKISCEFDLKPGFIPTIQLKNNLRFIPTQYLETSDGENVTLYLTNIDLKIFLEHYNTDDLVYHSGWKFQGYRGFFNEYIDKWMQIKIQSSIEGNMPMRTISKLMLNSLYGKFAINPKVQSKYPYLTENNTIKYRLGEPETREPLYIPMATFITSWARHKTITSAQKCFDRFLYADTDSLHLIGSDIPDFFEVNDNKLGAWKHESTFTRAKFIRQKTYCEEIDGKLHITCAGMPSSCYDNVTWDNFKRGSEFSGKLLPKHVPGGIVLEETFFTIKL